MHTVHYTIMICSDKRLEIYSTSSLLNIIYTWNIFDYYIHIKHIIWSAQTVPVYPKTEQFSNQDYIALDFFPNPHPYYPLSLRKMRGNCLPLTSTTVFRLRNIFRIICLGFQYWKKTVVDWPERAITLVTDTLGVHYVCGTLFSYWSGNTYLLYRIISNDHINN